MTTSLALAPPTVAEPIPWQPIETITPDYELMAEAVQVEMNELRLDPRAYARKLEHQRRFYVDGTVWVPGAPPVATQEGVAALDEAVAVLKRAPRRLPQLAWSGGLTRAALDHALDLGRRNRVGHGGSDGSRPEERAKRYGKLEVVHAENITFGAMTGREVVIDLLIDDGVADRGHRDVLLAPELRVTGVACGPHPTYRIVCVMEYAGGFRPYRAPARRTIRSRGPGVEL